MSVHSLLMHSWRVKEYIISRRVWENWAEKSNFSPSKPQITISTFALSKNLYSIFSLHNPKGETNLNVHMNRYEKYDISKNNFYTKMWQCPRLTYTCIPPFEMVNIVDSWIIFNFWLFILFFCLSKWSIFIQSHFEKN